MTRANPPSTPLSTSKSAALSRVLDLVARGYIRYTAGQVPAAKLLSLLRKFHDKYGVGCSPAQRITRKQRGLANAALVLFLPAADEANVEILSQDQAQEVVQTLVQDVTPALMQKRMQELMQKLMSDAHPVEWLLMVTPGHGPVTEMEALKPVTEKPKLIWLGYELVRHATRGKISWTWRRSKAEVADWYASLGEQLATRKWSNVAEILARIARQPGFAGVRKQSWELMQFARRRGYSGELPFLFHVQKMSHGARLEF